MLLLFLTSASFAATRYVSLSGSHTLPFISWETAATNIQEAIDASEGGDTILVTNGVYNTGGKVVRGALTNRVAVDKPITVQSVNGPEETSIVGKGPGGDDAVRCVYVGSNATLIGFTLTNGHTRDVFGGGDECGGGGWLEVSAVASNCIFSGNNAREGGGVRGGVLRNCVMEGNGALVGGGASGCVLNNCLVTDNAVDGVGGGVSMCTLSNSVLLANRAQHAGGAHKSRLVNCLIIDNDATYFGGVYIGELYNCTVSGNASAFAGGIGTATSFNSVVYHNFAPSYANHYESTFSYSCTVPLPKGPGNIDADPLMASLARLSVDSPCIGAGNMSYATGKDIDGEAWKEPPAIGCDEVYAEALTGTVSVAVQALYTNVAIGFAVTFEADIDGLLSCSAWNFDDGVIVSNRPVVEHAFSSVGNYAVVLTAFNETYSHGLSATVTVHVTERVIHHVVNGSIEPVPPFTNWSMAAASIQDAVDVAMQAGALVLVSNGTYDAGGKVVRGVLTNRVAIDKPITVQSVNGPELTYIVGNGPIGDDAVRCVYVGSNATLIGFTLTNGHTTRKVWQEKGGGAFSERSGIISNCALMGNAAFTGGGAYGGTLRNCTLAGNTAEFDAGGASGSLLHDCVITGNHADVGGGACGCTLSNCLVSGNSAEVWGGGAKGGPLLNCVVSSNTSPDGAGVYGCHVYDSELRGNEALTSGGGAGDSVLYRCVVRENTAYSGGGAWVSVLHNCLIISNVAVYSGGGVTGLGDERSVVFNGLIVGNTAEYGGGARESELYNCTVAGNSATAIGGGAIFSELWNCIVYYNNAPSGANWDDEFGGECEVAFSCITPLPPGEGNISEDPVFADADAGDFRLMTNSPCIDTGTNQEWMVSATDLDANPRILFGRVDMGCFEVTVAVDSDGDGIPNWWEIEYYGGPTNAVATSIAANALNTLLEAYIAGLGPFDVHAYFILTPLVVSDGGVWIRWPSVAGRVYGIDRSLVLADTDGGFVPLETNIPAAPPENTYHDATATNDAPHFYRIRVGMQ